MPTTRARHLITETDDVAAAIDTAAMQWPEDAESRASLVRRLILEGQRAVIDKRDGEREDWLAAVRRSSGALTGSYGADYLSKLRDDWPE